MDHKCKFDYIFKILILGDSGVGKTTVLRKFTDPEGAPSPYYDTSISNNKLYKYIY